MKKIIPIILLFMSNSVLAQANFEWALQIGGTLTDYASKIETDNNGNVYTIGLFSGTVDFDAGPGLFQLTAVGGDDIFIQKNDASGNFIWAKKIGGTTTEEALSFTIDVNNNIIATGEFRGTVDFDPGLGITNLTSSGVGDIFVLKLNSNGDFIWVKQMGSTGNEFGTSVITSSDGSIYTAGIFNTITDFDPNAGISNLIPVGTLYDSYIQKLDVNGNFLWVKQLSGTSYTQVFSMVVDDNDDLCLTGSFNGTSDFDPGLGVVSFMSASYDAFVLKINNSGNYIWARQIGGTSGDYGNAINADTNGDLFLTGYFANTVDFDPGALSFTLTSNGSTDAYILKLNELGNFQWVKQIGGLGDDVGYSIVVTNNGLVFSIGRYSNTVDFDTGPGTLNHVSNGSTDVYIHELDVNGNFIWAGAIGGASSDYGVSISLGNSSSICATGYFAGSVDFNPNAGVYTLTSYSAGYDGFILKLNTCGVTAPVPTIATLANITAECSVTTLTAPTATDNCAGTITGTYNATLPITTQGTTVVTWTYDDGNGNTSTQTQNVVIDDITAPVPTLATLPNVTAECSVASLTAPTATDNCAGVVTVTNNATLPITTQGTTVVNWTYDDGNGNTSTQTQNVVIDDITAPVPTLATLPNVTAECSVASLTAPTATDNCAGVVTVTNNATLPITTQGTTVVTWTYDDGNGNTSTQTQNVVIDDITAPVPTLATLANVTAECSVASLTAPTATDNCAGVVTVTNNATLPITTQGTTVVTWTYDDGNGNTSTQTQNVVIDDVTAPVPTLAALAVVTASCTVTSLTAPTATDNCGVLLTVTNNATLPITAQGTTVVTWTYDDGNGNTSTQTQNVIIDDATAPIADAANLSDITSECEVTSLSAPTATDNCAGTITATHNATLPITVQGTTVVTWTYDDGNGNTSTQTQNVIINDATAPIADVVNLSNITSECEVTPSTPTATDNCIGALTATPDVAFPITSAGTTVLTWTYDDGNGNTSTQTQNVVITPIDNGITQVDALSLSADASGYNYQWIDCDNGNQPINGATNQTFIATSNGNYAVEIDNGTCMVVSACMVIDEVGIKEIWETELVEVYPNPTTGILNIESKADIQSIELMDALGQTIKVYSANENKIEINTAPGVYFLRIIAEGSENIIRVVKQ